MDIVKINDFQNVGASQKATTQFEPEGPAALHGIIFQLHDAGASSANVDFGPDVDLLTIKHSGKSLFPGMTGARLVDLAEYEGWLTADIDYFFLPFGDPSARTIKGQHLGNFDFTQWPGRMTIELTLGACAGAVTPEINAWAVLTPPKAQLGLYKPEEIPVHRAFIETVIQPAAAITKKAFDIGLGSDSGAVVRRLNFFHAFLTELQIKRSGFDIYEDIPAAMANWWQQDVWARVAQAGLMVYDPIVDGNQSEAKATVEANGKPASYQVRLTTSAADTITEYADVYTTLRRL